MRRRVRRRARARIAVGLLFASLLSFAAGLTDAVGFLLAGDFVSFMSGNTTRFGIAAGTGDLARAGHLLALLAAFVAGNALGVLVMRVVRGSQPVLLVVVAALTALGAALGPGDPAIVLLVLAMGAINVALEEVGGQSLGLTYVTGALSRLGRGLARRLLREPSPSWWVQVVPWLGMAAGAVAGGVAEAELGHAAILASTLACAVLAVLALCIPKRWRRTYLARRPDKTVRPRAPG
ncbi:YoaK family protein [Aureimonas phyllosphaerae]|uniref:YoaK family protein n=1 Tax=Aureimonas phyllosphaerae TaxID=1166078 RepID=UPI003A5C1C3E